MSALIDWSKVSESLLLIAPTAAASAYIGARVKGHLDRARPQISLRSCRVSSAKDIPGCKLDLPPQLAEKIRETKWVNISEGQLPIAGVEHLIETLGTLATKARSLVPVIDSLVSSLATIDEQNLEQTRRFIGELSRPECSMICDSFIGGVIRQEVKLAAPNANPPQPAALNAEYQPVADAQRAGFLVTVRGFSLALLHPNRPLAKRLEAAAAALAGFDKGAIGQLLAHARQDLSRLAVIGESVAKELAELVNGNRYLIVEISILNKGRRACVFSPWGVLRVVGADGGLLPEIPIARTARVLSKPDDPIEAGLHDIIFRVAHPHPDDDDQIGFDVAGGYSDRVTFQSSETIVALEKRIPNLQQILTMEVFLSQVALRRVDIEAPAKKCWIFSQRFRFGRRARVFPTAELPEIAALWPR